jgi:hypothetical protein
MNDRQFSRDVWQEAIDWLVKKATNNRFFGDSRDGPPPTITIDNFFLEQTRYAAQAYRARLCSLSDEELGAEARAALDARALQDRMDRELPAIFERMDREALRERQSKLGHRHGLQQPILAAARYYRARGITAKQAFDTIQKHPFKADDDQLVEITKGIMKVRTSGAKPQRRGINLNHWQKRYWRLAR